MRRYRKGQIYRPPSAAECAAIADVAEAYRRLPARPQDFRPNGQIIEVKTPVGGIAARSGSTIYWEWCERCIHIGNGNAKTRVDTNEPIIVYNLRDEAIPGEVYVRTALTDTGLRCVLPAYGASLSSEGTLPLFTAATTFSTNNFSDGFVRVCNSSTSEYEIGSHGISFDTDHWETSRAGTYYIEASVSTLPPNPALGTLCDPALTSPQAVLVRTISADIEITGGIYAEFQDRQHFYNFIEHGGGLTYYLSPSGVVDLGIGDTVQLKIWADDRPGSVATTWSVLAARITFMRLNDEWST